MLYEDNKTFYVGPQGIRNITVNFKMTIFVFLTGSMMGFLLHTMEQVEFLNKSLKRVPFQIMISVLSIVQFWRAHTVSMEPPPKEHWVTYIHLPGFQWALFLFLLLLSSPKWNPFVAFLEKSLILCDFGKYSFGIYLHHYWLILVFYHTDLGKSIIAQGRFGLEGKIVLVVFIIYLIGRLWYFSLEKPLMILANKGCERLETKWNDYKPLSLDLATNSSI